MAGELKLLSSALASDLIALRGLKLRKPNGDFIETARHLPFAEDAINKSAIKLLKENVRDEGPRMFGPVEKTVHYTYDRKNHLTEISSHNPNGARAPNHLRI